MSPDYRWITVEAGRHPFLAGVFTSLDAASLRVFVESTVDAGAFDRRCCNGLVTALGTWEGRSVALAWSDFRVNAGCFGLENSRRFSAFLRHLRLETDDGPPLLYVVNSAGVSLTHGRALFADSFRLVPELLAYANEHLVLTCATGKCLGLGALLFGLGHYRMAVTGRTHLNLTGPEVISLFFGEGVDFDRRAAAETSHDRNDLVHELVPSVGTAFERLMALLSPQSRILPAPLEEDPATASLLGTFLDRAPQELVPGWSSSVRLFLGTRRGRALGIFINPPRQSNNLVTVRALEKYAAGLDLFRAMGVPIVSFLDSPGVDPRFEQSDAGNIRKLLSVGEKIIGYPHGSMGVIAGRCFGGASTLSIPKIFGGRRALALRGSTIGMMQSGIIDRVLHQSPRLREQWLQSMALQGPGLEDLLESGMLDAVIEPHELPGEIDRLLAPPDPPPRLAEAPRAGPAAANGGHARRGAPALAGGKGSR